MIILSFQVTNELAGKAVKEATTIATNTPPPLSPPVSFSSSIQVTYDIICDDQPTHGHVEQVYQHQKASRDFKQITNRKDDVFSSPHHYLHLLDPTQDPICLSCCLDDKDFTHWLCECPVSDAIRQQVFGNHKGPLEWLATRPGDIVAYARKTLVKIDA